MADENENSDNSKPLNPVSQKIADNPAKAQITTAIITLVLAIAASLSLPNKSATAPELKTDSFATKDDITNIKQYLNERKAARDKELEKIDSRMLDKEMYQQGQATILDWLKRLEQKIDDKRSIN